MMSGQYTITVVVGAGSVGELTPGHAAIQIHGPNGKTTYFGFGPVQSGNPSGLGQYDIIQLPNGMSPVGALRDPNYEYQYIDSNHYPTKSFSFAISDAQATAALLAAVSYKQQNPNYVVLDQTVCTD